MNCLKYCAYAFQHPHNKYPPLTNRQLSDLLVTFYARVEEDNRNIWSNVYFNSKVWRVDICNSRAVAPCLHYIFHFRNSKGVTFGNYKTTKPSQLQVLMGHFRKREHCISIFVSDDENILVLSAEMGSK